MNKKMNFAQLKAKANAVTTAEALNAIKGGEQTSCHTTTTPSEPIRAVPTYGGGR
jgi:hypothetical protein